MKRFLLGTLVVLVGCQKASDSDPGRQMPKLPPPPRVELPRTLHIDVEIDGRPAPPLDAARLEATKPDFVDAEHRAWRLPTLLGPAVARPGAVAAVTGDKALTVLLHQPRAPADPLPVLAESRRGGIVAALVTPDRPFPPYHGQGRRLARPGDPLPRIAGVTKIRVYLERDVSLDKGKGSD